MPTAPELELESGNDGDRVRLWRTAELVRAGYDPESARKLAENVEVDIHRAADLLRRGCDVETALRILL
jgi:hypothetical protein